MGGTGSHASSPLQQHSRAWESASKDGAGRSVSRAYSAHLLSSYHYHLLVIAAVASLYGLYYQLSGLYYQYASRCSSSRQHREHHLLHYENMYYNSDPKSEDALLQSATPDPLLHQNNYTDSVFLPFIVAYRKETTPMVNVTVHAGKQDVPLRMPVDTGSTGLLIGAPLLPGIDAHAGTKGRQYLSSSRIVYVGRYVDVSLTFHGQEGARAETTVPALIVDKSWVCPWYDPSQDSFECPLGPEGQEPVERDVSGITYMGVGFGRNRNTAGQKTASSLGNPFLNIHTLDGRPVGKSLKAGYIVSTEGIRLGLTRENTRKFKFMRLERGITHAQDPRDWAMPRMRFYIDGRKSIPGFALIDTGVPQMYIRAEDGMQIPTVIVRNPKEGGSPFVQRVKNGTRIGIEFGSVAGGDLGRVEAGYEIEVGSQSLMAPKFVAPGRLEPGPYVNTGRNFLKGYSIAFDAVEGRLGFRPVEEPVKAMI